MRSSCSRPRSTSGRGPAGRRAAPMYAVSTAPFSGGFLSVGVPGHPVPLIQDADGLKPRFHTHGWSGGTWPPGGAYIPERGPSRAHLHGPALGTRLAWREDRHGHSDNRTSPAGPQRRGATLVVTNHLREAIMASRRRGAPSTCYSIPVEHSRAPRWEVLSRPKLAVPLRWERMRMSTAGQGCA